MARTHIALVTPHNVRAVFVWDGEMGTRGRKLGPNGTVDKGLGTVLGCGVEQFTGDVLRNMTF